jgi:hypothetical protein
MYLFLDSYELSKCKDLMKTLCIAVRTISIQLRKFYLLSCCLLQGAFLLHSFFVSEDAAKMFLREVSSLTTGYTELSQKIELFITTAVGATDPA